MGVNNGRRYGRRRGRMGVGVCVGEGVEITGERPPVQSKYVCDSYERKGWVWAMGGDVGVGVWAWAQV